MFANDLREHHFFVQSPIEMVADNIIFAYRDEYYNPDTDLQGILELIVGKSRHGKTGTATVFFDKSYGIIKNLESV